MTVKGKHQKKYTKGRKKRERRKKNEIIEANKKKRERQKEKREQLEKIIEDHFSCNQISEVVNN